MNTEKQQITESVGKSGLSGFGEAVGSPGYGGYSEVLPEDVAALVRKDEDTSEIPRRCDLLRLTPAERAIHDALGIVEEAGCHPLLTDAVVLLSDAKDKVAEWADNHSVDANKKEGIPNEG